MAETAPAGAGFIATPEALATCCAAFGAAHWLALDTEFERSRTYFAELCLVQVAAAGAVACIDALALADLAPLVASWAGRTVILHAARQDLEVLVQRCGSLPETLFDTQLAAALCGHAEQIGYGDLVADILGVRLAKAATRTDWRQRPLSAEQLAYAADDVRYLEPVAEHLRGRLAAQGRLAWLAEDCAALLERGLYETAPARAWTRLKGIGGLPAPARARAAGLAAWREEAARARNLPRGWLLTDAALLDLAQRPPRDLRALAAHGEVEPGILRRHGETLLALLAAPGAAPPAGRARPDGALRDAGKQLAARLQARAQALGVAPGMLATRAELEGLVAGEWSPRLAAGWRHDVLADLLADLPRSDPAAPP